MTRAEAYVFAVFSTKPPLKFLGKLSSPSSSVGMLLLKAHSNKSGSSIFPFRAELMSHSDDPPYRN